MKSQFSVSCLKIIVKTGTVKIFKHTYKFFIEAEANGYIDDHLRQLEAAFTWMLSLYLWVTGAEVDEGPLPASHFTCRLLQNLNFYKYWYNTLLGS